MDDLLALGEVDFAVERLTATRVGEQEFYATLRRLDPRTRAGRGDRGGARRAGPAAVRPPRRVAVAPRRRRSGLVPGHVVADLERQLAETRERLTRVRAARDRARRQRDRARRRGGHGRVRRRHRSRGAAATAAPARAGPLTPADAAGPVRRSALAGSSACAMLDSRDQTSARVTPEPTKANQNGAASPHCSAMHATDALADDHPAEDEDEVDRAHAALELGRHRPLAHDLRDVEPHEGVGAEAEHDEQRQPRHRGQGEREVHQHLEEQAGLHQHREVEAALEPAVAGRADDAAERGRGGQQAEAHLPHPDPVQRPEHEDRPGRAPGDVEGQDHDRQGPDRRVAPQPADALDDVLAHVGVDRRRAPARGWTRCARPARRRARRTRAG